MDEILIKQILLPVSRLGSFPEICLCNKSLSFSDAIVKFFFQFGTYFIMKNDISSFIWVTDGISLHAFIVGIYRIEIKGT